MSSNNSTKSENPNQETIQHFNRSKENLSKLSAKLTEIDNPDNNVENDIDPLVSILAQKSSYKIVVVGSSAVENAIVEALTRSSFNIELHVVGNTNNPGIRNLSINKDKIKVTDSTVKIVDYAVKINADFVIVNSDQHIEYGIVDLLNSHNIKCFGPRVMSAIIQTDKTFIRTLLTSYDMNQFNPQYFIVSDYNEDEIIKTFDSLDNKFQIRNPKLSYSKGTKVMDIDFKTRKDALDYCFKIIKSPQYGFCMIEQMMEGDQFTMTSFVDGKVLYHMPIMQEYNHLEDDNSGILTNGMGCISMSNHSMPFLNDNDVMVTHNINNNVVAALFKETGQEYSGAITGNFIKLKNGEIKVVDYKCRIGDPYGINLLKIMKTDFMEVCLRVINSSLRYFDIECLNIASYSIYSVPIGYPNTPYKKREILVDPYDVSNIMFGNVNYIEDTEAITILGSRTIAVIGHGNTLLDAKNQAISHMKKIHGPLLHRNDIGNKFFEFNSTGNSYIDVGIDIDKNTQVVECIKNSIESTQDNRVISQYGDFCAVVKGESGYYSFSVDGVGAKSDLVLRYSDPKTAYRLIGRDLVFHGTGDVLTKGTLPYVFLDSFSASSIDPKYVKYLIDGIASACKECNCRIIGGETIELPFTFAPGKTNLMGFMVGYSPSKKKMFDSSHIETGDIVYAFGSTGPHTSGYSLIRKIIDESSMKSDMTNEQFTKFCQWVITEHGNYMSEINAFMHTGINIRAIAHITGGGLIKNPARIVPHNMSMLLNKEVISDNIPNNFRILGQYGDLDDLDMFRTFNCGIGMLVVVNPKNCDNIRILKKIQKWTHIWKVGHIIERMEHESAVKFYVPK
jgi:phosphoribosylamine--glycine ligase/phosphoribosylaminoimidazole synthetase